MDSNLEYFDVCIIGASISGNYLAFLLKNSNLKIGIIEDHHEIGLPFQCAGIVSEKLGNLIKLPNSLILNRVKQAMIVSPSGSFIKLTGDENPYIIDRIALDKLFYDKTKDCPNIKYYLGERFKSFEYQIENNHKIILVKTSKRNLKAKLVVGCDGPLSSVGKQLKVINHVIYASQITIKGSFNENEAAMYFNPQWKELFGWIVPEGHNTYRIGLATSHNIRHKFLKFLKILNLEYNDRISQQGGVIPYGIMKSVAFDNIMLLGDSAGQVKATTGGGIIMLISAAKIAHKCIVGCFTQSDFSRCFIRKHYEKPCRKTIGRQLKIHYILRLIIEELTDDEFKQIFQILRISQIENLISVYGDMDFLKSFILKMLRNSLVLRFLIKLILKKPRLPYKIIRILLK